MIITAEAYSTVSQSVSGWVRWNASPALWTTISFAGLLFLSSVLISTVYYFQSVSSNITIVASGGGFLSYTLPVLYPFDL